MEPTVPPSMVAAAEHVAEVSPEHQQQPSRASTDSSGTRAGTPKEGVVDVQKAQEDFAALRRELTRTSSLHRTVTGQRDAEKEGEDEDDFDLLHYMRTTAADRDREGFKRKIMGVIWDKLSVQGVGGMKIFIRTFPDAVKEFIMSPVVMIMMRTGMFKMEPKYLLKDFDGCAKPGEMVFVLGRPGAGCTTFLKTLANQRGGYLSVDGEVSYGGIDATRMGKRYKGQVVYNQEDDVHQAQLTVAQTINFALNTKTPGRLLPNQTRKQYQTQVMEVLLKMLGISHTKNTKVGSAFVRGVSGGERKRVSIAEMMTTGATVLSWDNSTRGLDASTALDYAKSIRIMTDVFQVTSFVSLYQAGEGIFEQFDKVLLIDEGRQVYYGPAKEARPYMISLGYADLPRQTSADYLTGCTDINERRFAEGRDATNVPSTPEAFAEAYASSDIRKRMEAEKEEYRAVVAREKTRQDDFAAAISEEKHRGVGKKSPYTVNFFSQVRALMIRQFQLKLQDRRDLIVSYSTAIIVAIITGSVYLLMPATAAGAFTRGGVVRLFLILFTSRITDPRCLQRSQIFLAILFNSFQAFNELPSQMMGRPILWKQANFAFYRPAATSVASTLADAPFSCVQILIFSIIVYFMSGLYLSAGAFFSFYIIVLGGFFSLASFFRLLGTLCSSYDVAARLAALLISGMVLFSGYLIPIFSQPRWLFWITYINPLNYSFSAAMSNEFKRLNLDCVGAYITPYNIGTLTKYPTTLGPNQVCTLPGSVAGNPVVSGTAYIAANFQYDPTTQWRDFGITLVFFAAFTLCQMWCVENLKHGADAPAINVFAKENKERKELNEALQANKAAFQSGAVQQNLDGLIETRKPFTWSDLVYTVPVSGGKLQLLDHVFGYVKPGTLTALMGSSGAGKTTLLDVLAQRKNIGVISGDLLIDGRPLGGDFQRGTAYVEQLDVHEHTATVREAFRFSAYLRQPAHISKEEKDKYVEEVIQLLELQDLADSIIGFPGFGLGVEARKRVTIGVELASKPQLLLFLDEPTSGLDGQSAFNIVRFLRKLAAAGQAILVTVHQPNAFLFEHFDRLLLLAKGGRTIYFGDIGKDSKVLRSYFAKNGADCPPNANPAEYMLEAIGAGSQRRVGKRNWADIWLDSEEFTKVKEEIIEINRYAMENPQPVIGNVSNAYSTSFSTQLKVVSERTFTAFWRNADYGFTRLFNHIVIALFVSLTFLNLGNSVADLQYRVFAIFFISVLPAIIISQIEPTFIMGRDIFIRESSSKMYSQPVFAMAQLMAEVPYSILCAVSFFLLFYYPMGFNFASSRAGYTFLMIFITEFYAVTLGQAVAALSPSIYIAAMQNPFLLIVFSLFCGVTVPKPNMPKFWRDWAYYLDPFTRVIAGALVTELHGLKIECLPNELRTFNPPAGQTCQDWAGDFIAQAGGYLVDGALTSACQYCQYAVGDEFYTPLEISFDTRWRDWGIMVAFTIFNAAVTIVASTFLRYAKR